MKITAFFVLVFGVIVLIASVMGMWWGSLIGLFLIISSYFLVKKKIGWAWADLVILLGLDGYFIVRWMRTEMFYPSVVMSGLSLLVTALLIGSLIKALKKSG